MLEKIDHIGIAVNSLAQVKSLFKLLYDQEPDFEEHVAEQRVNVAGFHVGESALEYLEPTSDDSPISKFLRKYGEGMHHVCVAVKDIDATLEKLKQAEVRLIDETPRIGAEGKRIAFVHPAAFNGVLLELSEAITHR